jgi:hypothetical protein
MASWVIVDHMPLFDTEIETMITGLLEYLSALNAEFPKTLAGLQRARNRIHTKTGFVVIEPSRTALANAQVSTKAFMLDLNARTGPGQDIGVYLQTNPAAVFSLKASMYQSAMVGHELRLYVWSKRQVVSDLIASTLSCVESGLLVPSLTTLRANVEQIADMSAVEEESRTLFFDFLRHHRGAECPARLLGKAA